MRRSVSVEGLIRSHPYLYPSMDAVTVAEDRDIGLFFV